MKSKLILLVLLLSFVLVSCSNNAITELDQDITDLKEEISSLIEKNIELEETLDEVTISAKSNDKYIKELKTANEEMEGELIVLKRKLENFSWLKVTVPRLENYVYELLEFEQILGYITKYDDNNSILFLDNCEWISMEETERINELGLELDRDFPSGFYIHNDSEQEEMYKVTERTNYLLIDSATSKIASKEEFIDRIKRYNMLCTIRIIDNRVIEVMEVYTP